MATSYTTYHNEIRLSLGDFGAPDIDGVTEYEYADTVLNTAITLILRYLDNHSGDGANITPDPSDALARFIIYGSAFLLASDPNRVVKYSEQGTISISRTTKETAIRNLAQRAMDAYMEEFGMAYAKLGAIEAHYDENFFSDYLESITMN